MARSPAITRHGQTPQLHAAALSMPACDERWELTERVTASGHFARSPLLSSFLLYIVAEMLAGRAAEITEHQIGVQVFGRSPDYRTVEDNIVRNYARQLRRRLADYFSNEGKNETWRISIPLGAYVPVFVPQPAEQPQPEIADWPLSTTVRTEISGALGSSYGYQLHRVGRWLLLFLCAILLVGTGWFSALRFGVVHKIDVQADPASALWKVMFPGSRNTYIVPADAGLNLLEDLSRRSLTLADYVGGSYADLKLPVMDSHSEQDLKTQHFTSFVDLQIISALSRLPQYNPERAILRFPRDLTIDDLRNANAIIIGSVGSNPWAAVPEGNANFRIVYRDGMEGASIVNARPEKGEQAQYVSHWNEPSHETYALISCLPNLDGSGRLLMVQGLDVAGTQAAAEALFHPALIASILHRAERRDGSPGYFEILLRTTSIESSATRTEIIGSRVY